MVLWREKMKKFLSLVLVVVLMLAPAGAAQSFAETPGSYWSLKQKMREKDLKKIRIRYSSKNGDFVVLAYDLAVVFNSSGVGGLLRGEDFTFKGLDALKLMLRRLTQDPRFLSAVVYFEFAITDREPTITYFSYTKAFPEPSEQHVFRMDLADKPFRQALLEIYQAVEKNVGALSVKS